MRSHVLAIATTATMGTAALLIHSCIQCMVLWKTSAALHRSPSQKHFACLFANTHVHVYPIVCLFSTGLIPRLSSQHQQLISTSGIVSKLMVHALNAGLTNLVTVYYAQERSYGNRGTQSFVGKNTRRQTLILPTSMRLVQYLKHSLLLVLTKILQNNELTPISTFTICILLFLPRSTT